MIYEGIRNAPRILSSRVASREARSPARVETCPSVVAAGVSAQYRERIGPQVVGQADERWPGAATELGQELARGAHVWREVRLGRDPHEAELRDLARRQDILPPQGRHPRSNAFVVHVGGVPQRQKGIHVEQIRHGKSARSARICAEVTAGVPGGASMTGRPVTGSVVIRWSPVPPCGSDAHGAAPQELDLFRSGRGHPIMPFPNARPRLR